MNAEAAPPPPPPQTPDRQTRHRRTGFSRAELESVRDATVPDLLGAGLRLLFVGINPGLWTAAAQSHFARRGNRFYPALYRAGLVDRLIDASAGFTEPDRAHLLAQGIGITNLVARATARADELTAAELAAGGVRLRRTVERTRPTVVAILGITAYRTAFGERAAQVGRQPIDLAGAELWVVPNPSGLNAHDTIDSLAAAYREVGMAAGIGRPQASQDALRRAVPRRLLPHRKSRPLASVVVEVPPLPFLMLDGRGDPNTSAAYREAIEALYTASYAVRAVAKNRVGLVHTVGPLEGLWSADDFDVFRTRDKSAWDWTMMIAQPDWITADLVAEALTAARTKYDRKDSLPALGRLRFEPYQEGRCVQILHIGSYDDEAPTIARLHCEFLPAHGLARTGRHHEIYLSDARRTEPARLKTILRQPITG